MLQININMKITIKITITRKSHANNIEAENITQSQ